MELLQANNLDIIHGLDIETQKLQTKESYKIETNRLYEKLLHILTFKMTADYWML